MSDIPHRSDRTAPSSSTSTGRCSPWSGRIHARRTSPRSAPTSPASACARGFHGRHEGRHQEHGRPRRRPPERATRSGRAGSRTSMPTRATGATELTASTKLEFGALGADVVPNPAAARGWTTLASKGYPLCWPRCRCSRSAPAVAARMVRGRPKAQFSRLTHFANSSSVRPKPSYFAESMAAAGLRAPTCSWWGTTRWRTCGMLARGRRVFGDRSSARPDGRFRFVSARKHGTMEEFAAWVEKLPVCASPATGIGRPLVDAAARERVIAENRTAAPAAARRARDSPSTGSRAEPWRSSTASCEADERPRPRAFLRDGARHVSHAHVHAGGHERHGEGRHRRSAARSAIAGGAREHVSPVAASRRRRGGGRGGVHRFMNYDGPMLTDSGGFQVFSLADTVKLDEDGLTFRCIYDGSKVRWTPEVQHAVQAALGADIAMQLDQCTPYPAEHAFVARAVDLSASWARRCLAAHRAPTRRCSASCRAAWSSICVCASVRRLCEIEEESLAAGGGGSAASASGAIRWARSHEVMFETFGQVARACRRTVRAISWAWAIPPRLCARSARAWTCSTACCPRARRAWARR